MSAPGGRDHAIVVANAPVSYGAFEITVGVDPNVPDGAAVLEHVASAGYAGIDLGPVGYLGEGGDLRRRLSEHGLGLAGGYLELPYSDPGRMPGALRDLDALLDVFDSVGTAEHGLRPKPTLADAGSDARRANPGKAAEDRSLGLDADGWRRFAEGLEMTVSRCRERGYEPTFHHETGTYVEAVWEIEKVLEVSSIGVCLDTGHLLLGGGDPLRALQDWGPRINHLHLKDARRRILEQIVREAAPVIEIWRRGAFCKLGTGDLDLDAVLDVIRESYSGWLVVEQDILPNPAAPDLPNQDQRANREFLRARGI